MGKIGVVFDWIIRLIPAAALFSMLFALDDNLRWAGLLGFIPLLMAFRRDCPTCDPRARSCGQGSQFRNWPGH